MSKSTYAELAAPHDQQTTVLIDVAEAQTARLAGTQPQSVAQREDRPVGRCPPSGAGVVGQRAGRIEQTPHLLLVEDVGDRLRGDPPSASAQRRDLDQLLGHGPVQHAPDHAQQMIETLRPRARTRGQELLQQRRRELPDPDHAPFAAEPHQQPQLRLGAVVLAAKGTLVRNEPAGNLLDGLAVTHESTSSPSPSATWRNCSTATFA